MNQLVSGFLGLNTREKWKAFGLFILAAVGTYLWKSIDPLVATYVETGVFDFGSFVTAIKNYPALIYAGLTAALSYIGYTLPSNSDGKFLKKD